MWEVVALPALAGSGLVWVATRFRRRRRLQEWHRAAESCGLEVEESSSVGGAGRLRIRARTGPLEVRIEASRTKGDRARIVIVVPGPPDFSTVRIRREGHKPLFGSEIEIGDEPFDRRFYVAGPVRLVRALLDAKARNLLVRGIAKSELEIVHGELRTEVSDPQIRDLLPLLLKLGRRFAKPLDPVRRLAEIAGRDPVVGVRLQSLLLLARELPGDPTTVAALHAALSDPRALIRLRAAKELGREGQPVLMALAKSMEDDAASAQAISFLGRELPIEEARAILFVALDRCRTQTACACLERLGQSGDASEVPVLARVMARRQGEVAAAAALALGATGSMAAEPPLLLALQHEHRDVWVAGAKALGRVGSAAAVLPLKEAAERHLLSLDLRRAARQSIAEIQSRLAGASPGQLSLAAAEAGQLSLAKAERGQLSLAAGPAPAKKMSEDAIGS